MREKRRNSLVKMKVRKLPKLEREGLVFYGKRGEFARKHSLHIEISLKGKAETMNFPLR